MRIGSALLATTAALALAFTAGSAGASTRHHARHHHATRAPAIQAPLAVDTTQNGNNPQKRYKERHDANARAEANLLLTGNNPTKRYAARHGSNLRMEATLSRSGNNGVKYYPTGKH